MFDSGLRYRSMVVPDIFIDQASPADMYAVAGMNADQIEAKVLGVLGVTSLDEASARGMPRAARDIGAAVEVADLSDIAARILAATGRPLTSAS